MKSRLSSFITRKPEAVDKMARKLDREMRAVKNWRHFATGLGVDHSHVEKLKWYGDFSPTIRLFEYLENVDPDLTVGKVKTVFSSEDMKRNDLSNQLNKVKDEDKVAESLTPKLIDDIALGLDRYGGVVGNWSKFALMLHVPKDDIHQFEMRLLEDPTARLFDYLETKQPQLTLNQLEKGLRSKSVKRNNLANLLINPSDTSWGSQPVKDVIKPESELLRKMANGLNRKVAGTGNWRNLANELGVPRQDYKEFEDPKGQEKRSATIEVLNWVKSNRPDITINDVVKVLENIQRFDVIEVITDSLGSTERTIQKLQQMQLKASKDNSKLDLIAGLTNAATEKGFRVSDNQGEGNCMFYALSEQLEMVKGIKIPHGELRRSLVQYLRGNPKQPDGTDLFQFVDGHETWENYLTQMENDGTWGDHLILVAASDYYKTCIHVVSSQPDVDELIIGPHCPVDNSQPLMLGHIFELHYVSLQPIQGGADMIQKMSNLKVNMDDDNKKPCLDKEDGAAGSSGPYFSSGSSVSQAVFLSYQWDLQSKVRELKNKLETEGISCWMDKAQLGGGDYLRPEINDAITNCKVFISCVSKKYCNSSDMGQREATLAHERKKRIIPVLFEDIRPWPPLGKLGLVFTDTIYIRLPDGIINDEKFAELLKQVMKYTQSK